MAELMMQEEASTPSTPSSGKWVAYFKASGLYVKDDVGNEYGPLDSSNVLLTTGGTSTAYTITTLPATALITGETFRVKFHTTAGATPTINRDGLGAKSLKYYDAAGAKQAATSAQIITDMILTILYDGTDYVILGGGTSGGGSSGLATGFLYGLTLANNATDATNDIDISIGKCRDITDTVDMALAAALTGKQLDVAWAVGSSAGFLDQGTIANATYHIHLIRRSDTGVVDAIASLSHDKPAIVTMTIASPGVVTMGVAGKGHGLVAGSPIKFSTTGALPTGVTAGTQYYVIATSLTETTFRFSTTNGGSAVNTSGSQSGVHTCLPGPKMPTNYDSFRRIGSIVRVSAAIKGFVQDGDRFMWKTPAQDVSVTNPGTSAVTRTLTAPVGIRVRALLNVYGGGAAAADYPRAFYISDLSLDDVALSLVNMFSVYAYVNAATSGLGANADALTNMSAQVRSRVQVSTAATSIVINTLGWMDDRGRA